MSNYCVRIYGYHLVFGHFEMSYIEIGLFKIKSPRALEIGMVQTSVISLALEIEIVRNAVKLEKLYSN